MTLVTTSRRPSSGSRAIARDLAFALSAQYLPRGKHGLREISDKDSNIFIISQEREEMALKVYHENTLIISRIIRSSEPGIRNSAMKKGIITSDTEFHSVTRDFIPVELTENEEEVILFDGPQRRQMKFVLGCAPDA